jgi:hypothetical protein
VVMYLCVRGINVPSQESEGSCVCVLDVMCLCVRGINVPSQESEWSCICVLDVMCLCVRGIDFTSFYDFDIRFWNCSGSVGFFVFHFLLLFTIPK